MNITDRIYRLFFLAIIALTVSIVVGGCTRHVVILHTNDLHGRVVGDSAHEVIGLDYIAAVHKATSHSILVDAGDALHGLSVATDSQGSDIMRLLNRAGYRVMTPGNHDFDYGADRLRMLADSAHFDLISANVLFHDTAFLPAITLVPIHGVQIGFIGLTTRCLTSIVSQASVCDIRVSEYLPAIDSASAILHRAGANCIVLLAHLDRTDSQQLARRLGGKIDVIIDGHSHIEQADNIQGIPVLQAGHHGKNLGRLTLTFRGRKRAPTMEYRLMKRTEITRKYTPDTCITHDLDRITARLDRKGSQPIVRSTVTLLSNEGSAQSLGVRTGEMPLCNLISDAMRSETATQLAFINGGGVRADLPKGTFTRQMLHDMLPFGNLLTVKSITPKQLKAMLEHGVAMSPETFGGFVHPSGFSYGYAPDSAVGSRIRWIRIAGKSVNLTDSTTQYSFTMSDFSASGGDANQVLATLPTLRATQITLMEAVAAYLQRIGTIDAQYAQRQERIVRIR